MRRVRCVEEGLIGSVKGALLRGDAARGVDGGMRAEVSGDGLGARALGRRVELEHFEEEGAVRGLGSRCGEGVGEEGAVGAGRPGGRSATVEALALLVVLERVALVLDLLEHLLGAVGVARELGETCGEEGVAGWLLMKGWVYL